MEISRDSPKIVMISEIEVHSATTSIQVPGLEPEPQGKSHFS
jgi:hypothetical protein